MTQTPEKSPEKSPVVDVTPDAEEELADHGGMARAGGLVDGDELLAKSGKSGGLTDDDTELA